MGTQTRVIQRKTQDHPLEVELGDRVLRSVLEQMAAWHASGWTIRDQPAIAGDAQSI